MEKEPLLQPLIEKAEQYGTVTIELLKLKAVDKTADVLSSAASRSIMTIVLILFGFTFNIGISLWLGELLGKSYYGFLLVSAVYAFIALLLLLLHPGIKKHFYNSVISQLLK